MHIPVRLLVRLSRIQPQNSKKGQNTELVVERRIPHGRGRPNRLPVIASTGQSPDLEKFTKCIRVGPYIT